MKKVHVSTIPGLKKWIDLITIFTLAGFVLQAVNTFMREIRLITVILYLLTLGVNLLLVFSLYAVLKRERTYDALGVISTTLKVVFIGICVLFGLLILIILIFLLVSIGFVSSSAAAGAGSLLLMTLAVLIISIAMLVIVTNYYRYAAKTARQLRYNEYDGSKKPETWAIVHLVASLVLLLFQRILVLIVPTLFADALSESSSTLSGYLMESLEKSKRGIMLSDLLSIASSLCQCASFYCVYRLLKTVRLNMLVAKK